MTCEPMSDAEREVLHGLLKAIALGRIAGLPDEEAVKQYVALIREQVTETRTVYDHRRTASRF